MYKSLMVGFSLAALIGSANPLLAATPVGNNIVPQSNCSQYPIHIANPGSYTLTGNIMSLCLGATVSASALVFLACLSLGVLPAFLLAILFGIALIAMRGWPVALLGLAGLVMGYGYTAPPFQYKYKAIGLPIVFVLMGPLMVMGALALSVPLWAASSTASATSG